MLDQRFVEYFKKWRASGYSDDQIKRYLISAGHDIKTVDDAMVESNIVSASTISQSISSIVSSPRKKLLPIFIIMIVVCTVLSIAYFVVEDKLIFFGSKNVSNSTNGLFSNDSLNITHNSDFDLPIVFDNSSSNNSNITNQSNIVRLGFGGSGGGGSGGSGGGGSGGSSSSGSGSSPVPTCIDGLMNQGETGIDCGGPCLACITCNDTIKNQDETDIDCGGSICEPCANYTRTFYVSNSGNDSNNGTSRASPWKTISKVNNRTFIAGDGILFKRGDAWHETLTANSSGNSTAPITFGAYGSGANPIITGFTTITGWTNEGGGIYSKIVTSDAQTNMVTVDGVNTGMGRYPDSTYLTYESFSNRVSITDNGLGDAVDWAGAEVVIRKNDWTLDRNLITDHTRDVITYSSGSTENSNANYGYFIQNDIRTLDNLGEWYHDTSTGKFYMYFGAVNPTTKTVKVATLNKLFYSDRYDYITIKDISFTGSIDTGITYYWGANYGIIKNCNVTFAGEDGIRYSGSYGIIDNNFVSDCVRTGIGTYYDGSNNEITNNVITNIGLVKGQSKDISSVWSPTSGIAVEYDNNLIQYNYIENIGYVGIQIAGNADILEVKNNFVNNTCLTLDDCGGIYIDASHSSVIIEKNIFLNAFGNTDGAADSSTLAEGIYLDELASNIIVRNNTAADNSNSGIKLHKANNNIIEDNTLFNNYAGINFESWIASSTIYGNVINRNIFFAKESTQLTLRFRSATNDIPSFGTADNNYYVRPINDTYVFDLNQPSIGSVLRTLAEWQVFTAQDNNSHKSSATITDVANIRFEYNPTLSNLTVVLNGSYIDVRGNIYSGNLTLLPFTSIILMKNYTLVSAPASLSCNDSIQNGNEAGIDCGGSCEACSTFTRTFYVSSSGNDSNNGTTRASAWKTISKINSQAFIAGDGILFKRGDIWNETLAINRSGNTTASITYSAYSTGNKPVITGFTTITGWTNESNGIYSKVVSSESSTNNIVTVNGVNTPMGRYPDIGYLSYESHVNDTSITDNELTNTTNWTGAELVLRRTDWTLNRNLITNHTNTIITYTPATGTWDGPTDGFGYFIQNDIKTLDDVGDWYYNGTTLYMYFGGNNPADYTVKISTLNELITTGIDYTTHSDYITLNNIDFEGSKLAAVYLGQLSSYWTIQNCDFNFNGKDGIYAVQTSFLTINNNTFNQINNNAIRTIWLGDHTMISNNTITNIGVLPGMGGIDDDSYDAIALQVRTSSNSSSIVEYNTLQHVGHIGMRMDGNGYIIQYNLITDYGLVKGDTGAIYTYHANITIISNNIVLNSNKALEGIGSESSPSIQGIYLDNGGRDIIISGNTVYNITDLGIFVQGSRNIEVYNNTVYASGSSQLEVRSKDITAFISGINVHHNIFFAKTAGLTSYPYSPLCALFSTSLGDINTWGVFDNNYYIRPIDDDDVFRRYDYALPDPWNGVGLTLAQWQAYSGYDVNSHKSPITIANESDILFEYNPTRANITITLNDIYVDVRNVTYSGNITLLPYTSIVLMRYVPLVVRSSIILPFTAYVNDTLRGYCNATEVNNTNLTYYYKWYLNGVLNISNVTSRNYAQGLQVNVGNVSNNSLVLGQIWTLECQASNGLSNSTRLNSSTLVISGYELISPTITFESPTPNNGSTVNSSTQSIVASITDNSNGDTSSWIDFDRSLVGYWSMDYYNATGIYDNSTYNNFGKFNGGLNSSNITTGARGLGLTFDGVNDYVDTSFNGTQYSSLTISFWARTDELTATNFNYILDNSPGSTGYMIRIDSGTSNMVLNAYVGGMKSTDVTIPDINWHFYTARLNTTRIEISIDEGSFIGNSYASTPLNASSDLMTIGSDIAYSNVWNGSIDELMIFSRVLSQSEINALYNSKVNKFNSTFTNLSNGQHNYTVYAKDVSGNINSSGLRTFIFDTSQSSCNDSMRNGNETGIDCGGAQCEACSTFTRTFYVSSSSGNDSNNGTTRASAWKTIAKVNSYAFVAGDGILFERGDTWNETLVVNRSGNTTASITYSAYSTGNKPVITGFTTITGWTNESNGIYSKIISLESATNNLVTVDNINTPMGRWPNTGWMTYESYSTNVSITDNELNNTPNWAGAELVFRKSWWTLERVPITNHTSGTINYTSFTDWGLTNGFGYFIQKDIKTLDSLGDWYYNGSTLYMYFGAVNPDTKIVKISTLDILLTAGSPHHDYIIVDGISFEGSSKQTIAITSNSHHWTIRNCTFDFAGKNCIDGVYDNHDNIVTNNIINHTNNNAIRFMGYGYNNTITYNTISNTGVLMGMMYSDDDGADAIVLKDDNDPYRTIDTCSYNTITNVGHTGIRVRYSGYNVTSNVVDAFALIKMDAGGLYTWGVHDVIFESNIILNGDGTSGGCGTFPAFAPPDPYNVGVQGIYLDELTYDVSILNNTAANNRDGGMLVQMSYNINITGNTLYNNGYFQMYLGQHYDTDSYSTRNVSMNNNIFFSKESGRALFPYMQICLLAQTYENHNVNLFGTFDNNYYARPVDQDTVFHTYEHNPSVPWNGTAYDFAGWQAYSGQDANSHTSPKNITDVSDILFLYNPTSSNLTVVLNYSYIDVRNVSYSDSVTLLPYTSLVLIKDT